MILQKPLSRLIGAFAGGKTAYPHVQHPSIVGNGHVASLYARIQHSQEDHATLCYQAPSSYRGSVSLDSKGWPAIAGLGDLLLCEQGGRLAARPSKGTTALHPHTGPAENPPPVWPLPHTLQACSPVLAEQFKAVAGLACSGDEQRFGLWYDAGEFLATDGHRASALPCALGATTWALDQEAVRLLSLALACFPVKGKAKDPENPKRSRVVDVASWALAVSEDRVQFLAWSLDGSAQSLLLDCRNCAERFGLKPATIRTVMADTQGERTIRVERDAIIDLARFYEPIALFDGPEGPSAIGYERIAGEASWGMYGPQPRMCDFLGVYHGAYLRDLLPKAIGAARKFPEFLTLSYTEQNAPIAYNGSVVMPRKLGEPETRFLEALCQPAVAATQAA